MGDWYDFMRRPGRLAVAFVFVVAQGFPLWVLFSLTRSLGVPYSRVFLSMAMLAIGSACIFAYLFQPNTEEQLIERLLQTMQSSRTVAWDWDVKTGRDVWVGDLKTMFGMDGGSYSGRVEDFRRRVHPDDRELVWRSVANARVNRSEYRASFRVVWPDGTLRWIDAAGRFCYSPKGEAVRMLGMATDVTEHRMEQAALSNLSHRLMETQEHERTCVAHELHDDIGQRVALLTIDLDRLLQILPGSPVARRPVEELRSRAIDLQKDVQAISLRLHSSKLELLGIVSTAASFCRDVADKHAVTIDFNSHKVPADLPADIALVLFRVLQEALANAIRHAGIGHFTVNVRGAGNEVQLDIIDTGVGFDPVAIRRGGGSGLVGMRERLALVGGEFLIDSRPGTGTRISARVPLDPDRNRLTMSPTAHDNASWVH